MPDTALKPKLPITDLFASAYLEHWGFLPLELLSSRVIVAAAGELEQNVRKDLEETYHAAVELLPVSREELHDAIRRVYSAAESVVEVVRDLDAALGSDTADGPDDLVADARDLANQTEIIKLVNALMKEAHAAGASDIHLEATRQGMRARYRIDGVLVDVPAPSKGVASAVVSRVKLLAKLDIAERRLPQDGRIRVLLDERELDLRVSTVPTLHGESVVLRLLDRGGQPIGLDDLGMDAATFEAVAQFAQKPHGLILATGPTGSGKTTTLYAALRLRRPDQEKVITVEDPVEYHLEGVTQVQAHHKVGLTFAGALRSIVRQDPDVLMVGEMRDAETAATALQSALTGHLVFSTLHTNDAASAIPRLLDLGVEPYRISSTLRAVIAQRLVRRICPQCRERYDADPSAVALLAGRPVEHMTLERGAGCGACRHTGYQKRTGIFELLIVWPEIRDLLRGSKAPGADAIRDVALAHGMVTLKQDGWAKVQAGITTVEEVLRVADN